MANVGLGGTLPSERLKEQFISVHNVFGHNIAFIYTTDGPRCFCRQCSIGKELTEEILKSPEAQLYILAEFRDESCK